MKKKFIFAGIILGIIHFLYFYFLLYFNLYLFYPQVLHSAYITNVNIIYFVFPLIIFIAYALFIIAKQTNKTSSFFHESHKKKFLGLFEFIGYSILLFILLYLIFKISFFYKDLIFLLLFLPFFIFFSNIAINNISISLARIILLNIFYSESGFEFSDNTEILKVYEYDEFSTKTRELINQSQRFKLNTGFIIIYSQDLEKSSNQKFLNAQINFLLTESSRNYEPWGKTENDTIYVKAIEIKDKNELIKTSERFFSLLSQYQFYSVYTPTTLKFKILCLLITNDYFKSNKLNSIDEIFHILTDNFKTIKAMKQEFKIIEIE